MGVSPSQEGSRTLIRGGVSRQSRRMPVWVGWSRSAHSALVCAAAALRQVFVLVFLFALPRSRACLIRASSRVQPADGVLAGDAIAAGLLGVAPDDVPHVGGLGTDLLHAQVVLDLLVAALPGQHLLHQRVAVAHAHPGDEVPAAAAQAGRLSALEKPRSTTAMIRPSRQPRHVIFDPAPSLTP